MLATGFSGAVQGGEAYTVEIEVNAGHGDPQVVTVGLPDAAVTAFRTTSSYSDSSTNA
jgi:magnesium chelatase family protein